MSLCCLFITLQAQQARYFQAIDSARMLVEDIMAQTDIPGASVTVMVDGRIVWSEGFGL